MSQMGYEKSDTNVRTIIIVAVVSIAFVIISVVFLNELFLAEKERLIHEIVLVPESEELLELRAYEAVEAEAFRAIDSTGRYQIPIDLAMELIAAEAKAKR